MPSELAVGLVFRVLLPLILTAACVLRFNGFSLVYVLLMLLLPLLPEPSTSSGRCVTAVCVSSFLFLLLQSFFQLTSASLQPESNCTSWQKTLAQVGLVSLTGSDAGSAVRQVFPDVGVLVVGLLTWRLIGRLNANTHTQPQQEEETQEELVFEEDSVLGLEEEEEDEDEEDEEDEEEEGNRNRVLVELEILMCKTRKMMGNMTTTGGKVLVTVLLGLTGIMFPSLSSLPYLLCFQVLCTWWALSGQVPPLLFRCVSVMSLLYSSSHFLLLYCYQLPSLQEVWPPNCISASAFGLLPLVSVDCSALWRLQVNSELSWFHFCSPLMLLLLYNTVATLWRNQLIDGIGWWGVERAESAISVSCDIITATSNLSDEVSSDITAERRRELWRRAHDQCRDVSSTNDSHSDSFAPPTQSTALGLDISSMPHYSLSQSDTLETCVFEGDGWEEEEEEEEKRRREEEEEERRRRREEEEGVSAASMAFSFLLKQSYLCALMAMMAWPITYVSWLTCVLLLWSCVLWMMRERRRYTLMSSPWLVAYGNLLVIMQYVYSFPSIQEVPGLFPRKDDPCRELASKLLCLMTFWLLLRQALTEKRDRQADRQADTQLSNITVHMEEEQQEEKEVPYEEVLLLQTEGGGIKMEALGAVVTRMFVKYWIYVCGTMFFFVSFEGKIVLYKVIYMVMFLCCVALYQLNYERWRAMLRGFWVAVVVYSMSVLILVYTFQFPSSLHTWSYYTGLSTHRLEDVGLEKFSVPVLFTRIFIPAAFLLVCIVHLHYFHKPFLQLTDLKTVVDTHNSTITRLVHSDGSLFDLSLCGAPQLLLEAAKSRGQRERETETKEKWKEEEEEEEEYPCVFERETLSDHIKVLVSWRLVVDRLSVLFLRLLLSLQRLQHLLWWLLELHIVKIVSSYIIWISVKEVCVFNLLFVLCVGVALPCRAWRPLLSGVCTVWTCVVTVCKMLYQLKIVQPVRYASNCTMPGNSSTYLSRSILYSGPVDPAQWVGLRKTDGKLLDYLRYNLMMLALLAFEVTVYRHQELYRLRRNEVPPPTRTLFHDITRCHLDSSVLSCIKYFLNYFFYKFGLETCFLLAVNVIGQRMDLFAVGHAFGLISVLSKRGRKHIASVWPKYCYFLSGLLCFQYLLCIGFPPAACKDYPWRPPSFNMDSNVVKWLFLPDHLTPPNPIFLLYDFLLLLGASLQLQVFEEEHQSSVQTLAGDNCELEEDDGQVSDPIRRLRLNTGPDFMLCRSYLDMMKLIIFSYMFWFVLTIIFITGTTRISIFCMGYLVACFYFLLVGGDLLLKPVKSILVYWDCLIGYNVFVITMKNILSILACGFIKSLVSNHCWLIQLFSLACTIKGYTKPKQQSSKQCELPSDEAGIIWDGVCFCFLLLQRRVFRSHYFLCVVLNLQNTQLLASRGAELFEASTVKAVRARLEVEKTSMDLLKRQMERIKSRQKKFRRGKEKMLSLTQDSFHTDDQENRKGRSQKKWWRPWVNHASMVRSGDYYLFETDSEEEEEEEEKKKEEEKEEEQPDKSAFQFVYHAWITDSRTAMRARNNHEKLWKKNSSDRTSRTEEKRGGIEVMEDTEDGEEEEEEEEKEEGPDTVLRRFSSTLRFCWVLLSALLDSLTAWLRGLCQEHIDISTVLRIERCMLTQQAKQGNVPTREAIHVYYQEQMMKASRESGLNYSTQDAERQVLAERGREEEEEAVIHDPDEEPDEEPENNPEKPEPISGGDVLGEPEPEPKSGADGSGEPEPEPTSGADSSGEPEADPVSGVDGSGEPEPEPKSGADGSGEPEAEPVSGVDGPGEPGAETKSGVDGLGEPEPVSGVDVPGEPEAEPVSGVDGLGEPGAEPVSGVDGPGEPGAEPVSGVDGPGEPGAEPVSGADGPDEPVPSEAPSSGVEPERVTAEGDSAVEDYPEDLLTKNSQRWRPKLTRMERVPSPSSSSSSEEEPTRAEESKPTPDSLLPPSYSLALGLDLQDKEEEGGGAFRRRPAQTPEERSDFLSDSTSTSCLAASGAQELTASELLRSRTFYDAELEASDRFYGNQHQLLQMCYALYNILAARSETVCYLVIVLNHMVSASCLTLVLPVLVFLWATLSVPRPSKTFWMTAIIYTEVTIVIKYFFQFGFFPFNQKLEVDRSKPFHPPNILGVEKKEGYVLYDLLQLLALFYHRAILKCHGLWDQTITTENDAVHHDIEAASLDLTELTGTMRRRGRRTTSSCTQLRSPAVSAGSGISRAQQPGRLALLLEKLRELSIRAKKSSVSRCMSLYHPVLHFFRALVQPEYSAVTDVYVLMFLADTVDFIIIVFGFWAFGKHSAAADITSSLSEDQVPEAFLVMVLIQFGTMVIDRALYLRKTVLGKLVFQVILVFGIHFWMFFILPTVTERRFNQNLVAQLWYFVKCVYFGLSAYQIRSGYPTRVLGNFLTKSYNYLNLFLFQGFRLVPFLTELRAVMDWVWTDTTLSLSSWICVEDVYAHCFVLKCWRESEMRYPQPRGQKKKRVVKYGMGGLIVLLLICIVWFPLLFMSLIKSVAGVVNRPIDVSLTITLGGFQPIFTMSAQQNQLRDVTEEDLESFTSSYSYTPSALQFLEAYGHEDVTVAELQGSSNSLWTISPPSRQYLSQVLSLDHFPLTVSWTVQRNLSLGAKAELASGKHVAYLDDQTRLELIQLLNGTRSLPVVIHKVFPCFIRAPSDSNSKPIEQLYSDNGYKDILLALERSTNQSREIQDWWIVDQPAANLVPIGGVTSLSDKREAGLQLFVFSDKVSPPSLGFLAGYGIMGLYASVVLVIGKFVREFFSGISHSIMFEELPCVDRILKLCTDVFLVRETGELELEEELYAKLIFLYRSPETLIKWTRR
ncbi:piezo-type mechanosensitive ion channel component 2-like [Cyclopterus lumpus]|uniref:piezo-type mechanosensitive ion channel component 2-like n=1 Tax=Cyclopterus lumpus TaxID=8103 RepID=UPI001486FA43|nr:piezo-type mechanosensitive ion channel component 2-like [Cyclopterus lumpus]